MKTNLRRRLVKQAYENVKDVDLDETEWMFAYLDELIDLVLNECIDVKTEAIKRKFGVQ